MKRKRSSDEEILSPVATTLKVVDPEGDLLIILKLATEPFAVWPASLETFPRSWKTDKEKAVEEEAARKEARGMSPDKVEFKVSKKHITSACPRFKKMFSGPWLEANTVHSDGLFHVEIDGFDADAFTIVMYLIHSLNSKTNVPRVVGFELLAKIAVVVDDLQSYAAVQIISEAWISALDGDLRSAANCLVRTAIMGLWIGYVFADKKHFRQISREIIWRSSGPMPELGLPIPSKVTDATNTTRETVISEFLDSAHQLLTDFRTGNYSSACDDTACQCMLIGWLTFNLTTLGLYTRPEPPFHGPIVADIFSSFRFTAEPE